MQLRSARKAPRKKAAMAMNEIMSSESKNCHVRSIDAPVTYVERPRALRMSISRCSIAAVVAGEAVASDSRDIDVAVDASGGGK